MSEHDPAVAEEAFWATLRLNTQARIGLGRVGHAVPTAPDLAFRQAHAAARDAVHSQLDLRTFLPAVRALGLGEPTVVATSVRDRQEYLTRPDLGRKLADSAVLTYSQKDVGFVLADGLSPAALVRHGPALLEAIAAKLSNKLSIGPPVIVTQARVAVGDAIGEALGTKTVIVVIGERPGLSVPESLGVYVTHGPHAGVTDADRNCVSNVHPPEGLGYNAAAKTVSRLVLGARALGRSGIALKDRPSLDKSAPIPPSARSLSAKDCR